jgi:hypothetical protein
VITAPVGSVCAFAGAAINAMAPSNTQPAADLPDDFAISATAT